MRTYDPADGILYVHLAQDVDAPAAPPQPRDECTRLPADYANASLRPRLGDSPTTGARPALVLLPGGAAAADRPAAAPAAPALRLAR
ncbi:hypothetical protein [Geodermatophilus sp. URMC 64]